MARPKGARDKSLRQTPARKQALAALASAQGKTPLQVMLEDMRAKYAAGDLSGAADRAESCAPYVHARLSSTTVTHRDALDELTVDELKSLLVAAQRVACEVAPQTRRHHEGRSLG